MRILDNKKDIKTCVGHFEAMITGDIHITDVFKALDNVVFDYMMYSLDNNTDPAVVSENLFCLKHLRDLFVEKEANEK